MGSISNNSWYEIVIWVIMILHLSYSSTSLPTPTNKTTHITANSLDDYLYNLSSNSIAEMPYSNVLYNISLPSNLSSMEVSVLRMRSSTFWARGANLSFFELPPRIITMPYVKRIALMQENLGNLSSHFYDFPGFKFLTPIVGLVIYDATDSSGRTSPKGIDVALMGEPIKVRFPGAEVPKGRDASLMKCVRFEPTSTGLVELSNMLSHGVCSTQGLGHFTIAMPIANSSTTLPPSPSPSPSPSPLASPQGRGKRKSWPWTWWVIGFAVWFSGLVLAVSISVLGYKAFASRKIRRMESKAEKAESLDTRWVGNSKLPWASMTRTQATNLENDPIP